MITKKDVLGNLELVKKYIQEGADEEKKTSSKLQILSETGAVLYESEKTTLKEAVVEAVGREANLCGANLRGANLRGANLYEADLCGANLYGAELENAKFYGKGGTTKIKKSQINDFLTALGIIVEG